MSAKRALITGCTGQDGSFISEFLLEKGYEVHGLVRPSTTPLEFTNIGHIADDLHLHEGDLTDSSSIDRVIREVDPQEIYNLAALTHVKKSFQIPTYTLDVNANGFVRILESVMRHGSEARIYQASTSEIFGGHDGWLDENSIMTPRSPYACAKHVAYTMGNIYREGYGMHISNGILFNHESERRGHDYVTRKITRAVAKIHYGKQNYLELGNLEARRDWGYAKEYVEAMWLMTQQEKSDNYVIATGQSHSVQEFVDAAFEYVNLDPVKYVRTNENLKRPTDVGVLCGDGTKAQTKLRFTPRITFKRLVEIMMEHDLEQERLHY